MGRSNTITLQSFNPERCECQCGNTHEYYGGKGFYRQSFTIVQEGPDTSGYYAAVYECKECGKNHLVLSCDEQELPKYEHLCTRYQLASGY